MKSRFQLPQASLITDKLKMESEDERVESETALSLERKTRYRTRKRKSRKEQIKFARACKQAKRTRNLSDEMSAVQSERTGEDRERRW